MKRFTKITLDYRLYLKKSQHTNGTFMKVQGAGCKAHEGGPFLRRHRGVEGNQASQVGGTQTQTCRFNRQKNRDTKHGWIYSRWLRVWPCLIYFSDNFRESDQHAFFHCGVEFICIARPDLAARRFEHVINMLLMLLMLLSANANQENSKAFSEIKPSKPCTLQAISGHIWPQKESRGNIRCLPRAPPHRPQRISQS